jgi:hypothetical protein
MSKSRQTYEAEVSALRLEQAKIEEEYKNEIVNKEKEYKTVERYSSEQFEQFKNQRESETARYKAQIEKIQEENRALELEIKGIENRHPQIIKAKNEEIVNLEKQIAERSAFYKLEQEKAEKDIVNYQLKSEEKTVKLRENIEAVRAKYKIEQEEVNKKYIALRLELERKLKDKKDELVNEEKAYFEQKVKLEKQKNELSESLRNLKAVSQEQLRQKEKEIIGLQSELFEKEKAWEQNWQQKEKEFAQEKALLIGQIENLNSRLKEEEESLGRKVLEKENEIESVREQYDIRLKKLDDEMSSKKVTWEQTNTSFSSQVLGLNEQLNNMQKSYEEAIGLKEKELSVLKSNLEFWELRSKTNEEKRIETWEEEKASLESSIKDATLKLNSLEKDYKNLIEEKERVLQKINEEAQRNENEKDNQWKHVESELKKQNEHLKNEVELWQQRIKEETTTSESRMKTLEREIERLKLEGSLKDTVIHSEQQKMDREYRKMQQKLKDDLMALEHRMAEEQEEWLGRVRIKEEEIDTLKVRLALREERRLNEVKRREEEVKRAIKELEDNLVSMQDDYNKNIPNKKERVETLQQEMAALLKIVGEKDRQWKEKQETKNKSVLEAYGYLSADIKKLEEDLDVEGQKLYQLFTAKEKQIQSLTMQMSAKESELVGEREYTQEVVGSLRSKTEEFKRILKNSAGRAEIDRTDDLSKSFESAIDYFNTEKYKEAKDALSKIIYTHPEFSGAYKYMALCQWNLGQKHEAIATAEKALEIEPHNEELISWIKSIKNN